MYSITTLLRELTDQASDQFCLLRGCRQPSAVRLASQRHIYLDYNNE